LASVAIELGLGNLLKMSKGEEATGGRDNPGLLADTFEAVLGGLYIDQGFEAAEKFLTQTLFVHLDQILTDRSYKDAKSELQERVQALGFSTPDYVVIDEVGPDHDKTFTITVSVGKKVVGRGVGRSKQQAQQAAAEDALKQYRGS
jgi:ribonuclease-3